MDYQNAEFYRLNKNNTALIFNFAGERITYANCGFGCSPTSTGRKIFGFFVADGERAQFERGDFLGIADPEQCPDWVSEKIAKRFQGQQNIETGGMTIT